MDGEQGANEAAPLPTQELAYGLVRLAAWLKRLETQAHLIHANYTGANFLSVHPYLKERYEEHLDQFDRVLELLRTLGYWVPSSDKDLIELTPSFECLCGTDGAGLLTQYRGNIEVAGGFTKELEPLATNSRSIDVANVLAEISGQMWQVHWFLGATLGC